MKKILCFLLLSISTTSIQAQISPLIWIAGACAIKSRNPVTAVLWDVISGYFLVGTWFKEQAPHILNPPLKKISPRTTVFAFDLHDVMFSFDMKKLIRVLVDSPHRWRILAHFFNPFFLWDFIEFSFNHDPLEQYVHDVIEPKYPRLQPAIGTIYAFANSVMPIPGTLALIDKLHARGYSVYLLSNIDAKTFEHLKQQHPEIFEHFDGFFMRTAENNYLRKPHDVTYQDFIRTYRLQDKQIIFVDDLVRNIRGAEQAGMYGIFFEGPESLEHQLQQLGVL